MAQSQTALQDAIDSVRNDAAIDPRTSAGANMPSPERALLLDMAEHYEPRFLSIEAARNATVKELERLNRAANALTANRKTTLSLALADLAFYAAKESQIVLDANAVNSFRAFLAKDESIVRLEDAVRTVAVNEKGDEVKEVIETTSVLASVPSAMLSNSLRTALLFAIGHLTGVQVGCMKAAGKRSRFTVADNWEPLGERKLSDLERTHYLGFVVPEKMIWPMRLVQKTERGRSILEPIGPNERDDLVYLQDRWADALYQRFFAGVDLKLNLEPIGDKRPTGEILPITRQPVTRGTQDGTNTGTIAPESVLATAVRRAAGMGGLASQLFDCSAAIVTQPFNQWDCPPDYVICGALYAARSALRALVRDRKDAKGPKANDGKVRAELIALYNEINTLMSDDKDEYLFAVNDEEPTRLVDDQEPLPLGINPLTAALVKEPDGEGDEDEEEEETEETTE